MIYIHIFCNDPIFSQISWTISGYSHVAIHITHQNIWMVDSLRLYRGAEESLPIPPHCMGRSAGGGSHQHSPSARADFRRVPLRIFGAKKRALYRPLARPVQRYPNITNFMILHLHCGNFSPNSSAIVKFFGNLYIHICNLSMVRH